MSDTESTSGPTAQPDELEDSMAVVLSSPTRKRVLEALRTDGTLAFSELARSVSDTDDENSAHASAGDDQQTTVMLYHRDLPKLSDYGLVEWNDETGRAALTRDGVACATALGL